MKLHELAKRMKKTSAPATAADYRRTLDAVATAITGAETGTPEHAAIAAPRRGRPRKGEHRASVLTAIRLPAAVAEAARRMAKREHRPMHAALRDAVTTWAMT